MHRQGRERRNLGVTAWLLVAALLVAACAPVPAAPTVTADVVAEATQETLTAPPTAVPAQEKDADAAASDWTTTASIDGDYYMLGNPAAPIRLIDYGDFL